MKFDDDKILIAELSERKEEAFNIIFNKYFKSIYNFISQNCKSIEDAKDLTQEVFIRLWENCHTPIFSLKGYLYAIARNVVIDWIRKDINKLVIDALNDEQQIKFIEKQELNETDSFENLLSVIHCFAKSMPERRLEVYHLRWIEGLPRKEIAKKMGITVTTVDIHLQKGLEYLRKKIAKLPEEFENLHLSDE